MGDYVEVATTADLPDGGVTTVSAFGYRVALFRQGEAYHALLARCPHAGGPLEEGWVHEVTVTCPWHASRFDLATGQVQGGPSVEGVPTFPVAVEGERILVGPPPPGTPPPSPSLF